MMATLANLALSQHLRHIMTTWPSTPTTKVSITPPPMTLFVRVGLGGRMAAAIGAYQNLLVRARTLILVTIVEGGT